LTVLADPARRLVAGNGGSFHKRQGRTVQTCRALPNLTGRPIHGAKEDVALWNGRDISSEPCCNAMLFATSPQGCALPRAHLLNQGGLSMPPRFVARQLSNPTGIAGSLIGRLMNRTNVRMNAFALAELDVAPSDRVLEIGFGGGLNLPTLIEQAAFVTGLDRSEDMVRSVEKLPFDTAVFDKICTVNTIYFWESVVAGVTEIARVLKPGGRVVIGFLPKERMDKGGFPTDIFTARAPEEIVSALSGAGFKAVEVKRPDATTAWNVIVATL
jgi:arsenite methyltransferase